MSLEELRVHLVQKSQPPSLHHCPQKALLPCVCVWEGGMFTCVGVGVCICVCVCVCVHLAKYGHRIHNYSNFLAKQAALLNPSPSWGRL